MGSRDDVGGHGAWAEHVTQSAITKSIAELERQLGYLIFHRTSRGALLTDAGRSFVDRATRLLEDAKALLRENAAHGDAYAGILRVGVCPASLEWQVVAPLTDLLSRYPSLRFDVSGASFERIAQQLRNGDVDVVVGFEDAFAERPDFRASRWRPKTIVDHMPGVYDPQTPALLQQVDDVLLNPGEALAVGAQLGRLGQLAGSALTPGWDRPLSGTRLLAGFEPVAAIRQARSG